MSVDVYKLKSKSEIKWKPVHISILLERRNIKEREKEGGIHCQ